MLAENVITVKVRDGSLGVLHAMSCKLGEGASCPAGCSKLWELTRSKSDLPDATNLSGQDASCC